jgi:membrane-associated phospholipid phosphatase
VIAALLDRPSVHRFDERADALLERTRGVRPLDALMRAASHLADFSLIWHLAGAVRGVTSTDRASQAVWFSLFIGAESIIVNQGLKRLVRRTRPTETGDPRLPVRRPSTSSFPSGHASAACFAATLMTIWSGWAWAPAWFAAAAIVGTSRAYVRIHHPSDIVGGAVVGVTLGLLAWPLVAALPSLAS